MTTFAGDDLQAADLLALARPDGGRHRTTMIAAAPGRARQQLTPSLLGIG
jgi:hypothetical protein